MPNLLLGNMSMRRTSARYSEFIGSIFRRKRSGYLRHAFSANFLVTKRQNVEPPPECTYIRLDGQVHGRLPLIRVAHDPGTMAKRGAALPVRRE